MFSKFMNTALLDFVCLQIHKIESSKRLSGWQVPVLDEFRTARDTLDPDGSYEFAAPVKVKRGPRKPTAAPKS
jgi:hypothetical protein